MAETSAPDTIWEHQPAFLAAVLDTVANLVVVLDSQGRIVRFNRACEQSTGYAASEVVGRPFWDIFLADEERDAVKREFAGICAGSDCAIAPFENYWVAKDGTRRHIQWINSPLREGDKLWIISAGTDITEQIQAQAELQASEEQFRAFMDNSPLLAYIRDEAGRFVYVNRGFERASKISRADFIGKTNYDILPPDEAREACEHDLRVLESNQADEVTKTTHSAGGAVHHWLVNKFPLHDAAGARFVGGVAMDISERKRAEEKLRDSEERYSLAMRGANDGLWDWNLVSDEIYFSPRWKAMLSYEENEVGSHADAWFSRIHPADIEQVRADLQLHFEGATDYFENEHRLLQKDETYRWMLARGLAIRSDDSKPLRMAGSMTDMTERKVAEQQLLHDVLHDHLTGLPNRALFLDRVEQMLMRSRRRESYCFAVLFLDLDNFKGINDTLGHEIGDQLLKAVAGRLKGCLRRNDTVARADAPPATASGERRSLIPGARPTLLESGSLDMVARLGGDEFTILLEDVADQESAMLVADRFRQELEVPFVLSGMAVQTTLSIGIALSEPEHESPHDLLRQADSAMYEAKARGKSQARLFVKSVE